MQSVVMLNVANKPFLLSVIMLSVIILSVVMLSVIILSVIMLNVVILSVVAPIICTGVPRREVLCDFFNKLYLVKASYKNKIVLRCFVKTISQGFTGF
jgi:hypothetical protein